MKIILWLKVTTSLLKGYNIRKVENDWYREMVQHLRVLTALKRTPCRGLRLGSQHKFITPLLEDLALSSVL